MRNGLHPDAIEDLDITTAYKIIQEENNNRELALLNTMQSSIMLFNAQVGKKSQITDRDIHKMFAKFYGREINIVEEY